MLSQTDIAYIYATGFASYAHRNQKRKYTGEPYVNHCMRVASMVREYTDNADVIVAAALHDILEDTDAIPQNIIDHFGEIPAILVDQLTDRLGKLLYSRAERKELYVQKLAQCWKEAATIKLADMIDNLSTIVRYDPAFAKIYLEEKAEQLRVLRHGDKRIWDRAAMVLREAKLELEQGGVK